MPKIVATVLACLLLSTAALAQGGPLPPEGGGPLYPPKLAAVPDFEVTSALRKVNPDLGRSLAALVSAAISERHFEVVDRARVDPLTRGKGGPLFDSSAKAGALLRNLGAHRVFLGLATSFGERNAIFLKYLDEGSPKFSRTVTGFCSSVEDFTELVPKLVAKLCGGAQPVAKRVAKVVEEVVPEVVEKPAPKPSGDFLKDLGSPDAGIRFSAAVELGRAGDKSVAPALVRILKGDRDTFVRRAAARSLGELNAWRAVPALIDTITDPEYFVAVTAHQALKTITGQDFGFGQNMSRTELAAVAALAREWWEAHKKDRED